ncbi:MAG: hypothetical protein HQL51_10555 [Magnetococcales bacterium]|nr:hypothetical protein [Magnetococcales bacterium]
MSNESTQWQKNFYVGGVHLLAQQKGSRLINTVRNDGKVVGERVFFDRLGAIEAQEKNVRFGDTPLAPDNHSRRCGILREFNWAKLTDHAETLKSGMDPTKMYQAAASHAMGRRMDSLIIDAANGTAYTGKNGTTAVQLPASQKIAVGAAGLTIAKLIEAREKLDMAEIDPDAERFCVVTAKQISNLLNTTEVKSEDYNEVKGLVQGKVETFMGFKFIRTERLTSDASGNRLILCYAKPALGLLIGRGPVHEQSVRGDKSNAVQIYVEMTMGAARIEDEGLVQIACSEA